MNFSLRSPAISQCDPLKGHSLAHTGLCCVCTTPGIRFLGKVALTLTKGCCCPTPSEWTQKSESDILRLTSQSLHHCLAGARASLEPWDRCRLKRHTASHSGCQNVVNGPLKLVPDKDLSDPVLSELLEQDRVLSLSLVQKQMKAIFFNQRIESC